MARTHLLILYCNQMSRNVVKGHKMKTMYHVLCLSLRLVVLTTPECAQTVARTKNLSVYRFRRSSTNRRYIQELEKRFDQFNICDPSFTFMFAIDLQIAVTLISCASFVASANLLAMAKDGSRN